MERFNSSVDRMFPSASLDGRLTDGFYSVPFSGGYKKEAYSRWFSNKRIFTPPQGILSCRTLKFPEEFPLTWARRPQLPTHSEENRQLITRNSELERQLDALRTAQEQVRTQHKAKTAALKSRIRALEQELRSREDLISKQELEIHSLMHQDSNERQMDDCEKAAFLDSLEEDSLQEPPRPKHIRKREISLPKGRGGDSIFHLDSLK